MLTMEEWKLGDPNLAAAVKTDCNYTYTLCSRLMVRLTKQKGYKFDLKGRCGSSQSTFITFLETPNKPALCDLNVL